jgi:hypothetical protein
MIQSLAKVWQPGSPLCRITAGEGLVTGVTYVFDFLASGSNPNQAGYKDPLDDEMFYLDALTQTHPLVAVLVEVL